jgi:phosphate transport system permease protein
MNPGYELFLIFPLVILGYYLAQWLGPLFEYYILGGDYRTWLMNTLDVQYDQRNSIVVGFAMGFAVIPIIFTICEDALSSIPSSLTSASLALGATKWETATRIVLPSASPGIFSAVMIGFGRAVGETMIVLMATGNTPILSFSPFNGMRTLSANIAVEIPEAPYQGTLYRVLFLAATLLFILTFIVNTVAEIVRQRLRKKYADL